MPWVKFKRLRVSAKEPSIVVGSDRFIYNTMLAKLAELSKNKFVLYHTDEDQRKIAFEFSTKNASDAYPVQVQRGILYRSSCGDLVQRNLWIRKIAESKLNEEKKFAAIEERKNFWVIQLVPAFEYQMKRTDKSQLPSEAKGIYRYIDKDKSIVYIGKGNIKSRLNEPERTDWNFDTIEYSIIEDDSDQLEWESYWIDKFKETNNGRLPYYNKVSGIQRS